MVGGWTCSAAANSPSVRGPPMSTESAESWAALTPVSGSVRRNRRSKWIALECSRSASTPDSPWPAGSSCAAGAAPPLEALSPREGLVARDLAASPTRARRELGVPALLRPGWPGAAARGAGSAALGGAAS